LKPHLQTTIWTLLKANASQREIERVTGISRHTIRAYQQRFAAEGANCPGVATGSEAVAAQIAPPWPPAPVSVATSLCEPHREFIEAQLRLKRNATAIYQDLVDQHGFAASYNSVKRFVAKLSHKEHEQFDRLSFLPGEEMQVDYGEGAPTRVPGTQRWRKPRLFVATLRYSRASFRCVIWKSCQQIDEHAARLCHLLFAIEGRVGQRKLWGIVSLRRRYPAHCVNAACAQALEQGVYSYRRVLTLTERAFAQAVNAMQAGGLASQRSDTAALTQRHALIREADEYGDLFAHAAAATTAATTANTQGSQA
jgi:hypothetical protein